MRVDNYLLGYPHLQHRPTNPQSTYLTEKQKEEKKRIEMEREKEIEGEGDLIDSTFYGMSILLIR